MYGDFHYKDKAVIRLSYLYNGNPYTEKTTPDSVYFVMEKISQAKVYLDQKYS